MLDDAVTNFDKRVPMKRPKQPAELATTYVMPADPLASFTSGTTVALHRMAFARLSPWPSRDSVSGHMVCGWRCLSRV
jgi:hypothetical protein